MASNETGSAGNTIRRHMSTLDSGHDRTAEETDKNCIGSLKQKNNFRTCFWRSKSERFSGVMRIGSMTSQFEDFKSEIVAILAEHVIPFPPQAAVAGTPIQVFDKKALYGAWRGADRSMTVISPSA